MFKIIWVSSFDIFFFNVYFKFALVIWIPNVLVMFAYKVRR